MTTAKKAAANRENAKKSTGPRTDAGKAVVSGNAIKHGILSSRLLLAGESADMYQRLLDDMNRALQPVGVLELALSEKIAATIWKQRRLVEAETATIEMGRDIKSRRFKMLMGELLTGSFSADDLAELSEEEREQVEWCEQVLAEFDLVDNTVMDAESNLEAIAEIAPMIYRQLKQEADEEGMEVSGYIAEHLDEGLFRWAVDLAQWCNEYLEQHKRRPMVQAVANLVKVRQSAPVELEVLARYQVALDAELYKAMEALRKQQEWRIRSGLDVTEQAE